jgi:hypothetical protein
MITGFFAEPFFRIACQRIDPPTVQASMLRDGPPL